MRRESMFCRTCRSSQRARAFADALLLVYGGDDSSVRELVENSAFRQLEVAEINTIGALGAVHALLRRLPRLSFSEYRRAGQHGELVGGVRNEDMCDLSYPDESFDLVLSSDTLEHVPDFRRALRETRRVLRPGGTHIFTVPVVASRARSVVRAELRDGELIHHDPPIYHGRGSGLYRFLPAADDLLVFTDFGRDLVDELRAVGFELEIYGRTGEPQETGARWVFAARVAA
jgi:SAM-dependent methyltransferase